MIVSHPARELLGPNRWPLNQDAKRRLEQAGVNPDPYLLYLVQLLALGFEKNLALLGLGGEYKDDLELAANQLLDPSLNPVQVMRFLLGNRSMGDQSEQNDTLQRSLQQAKDWQEAAQNLMQWFYDLKASLEPYYRAAPHLI